MHYLAMLDGAINRCSANSLSCKGFFIVGFTAFIGFFFNIQEVFDKLFFSIMALVLLLIISSFDIFHYSLEKKYRKRFEQVRLCMVTTDFSMDVKSFNIKLKIKDFILSWHYGFFYLISYFIYLLFCAWFNKDNFYIFIIFYALALILWICYVIFQIHFINRKKDGS